MSTTTMTPSDDSGLTMEAKPESIASTWVTSCCCLVCIGIFLGLASLEKPEAKIHLFGYVPADAIWSGRFWGLMTSAFVHVDLWHVAFNVYWLWVLGSRLERSIGSLLYLMFFFTSAFVSSAFQLAFSDTTGIGSSGVVYAMFGFMWAARKKYPLFAEALTAQTVVIFVVWLFACLAMTAASIWSVGNAAHFSGFIFGVCVATAILAGRYQLLAKAAAGCLVVASIVFCVWCPWSFSWLGTHAFNAHSSGRYQEAIEQYTRIIDRYPQNAWAFQNRSYAYRALGNEQAADQDFEMACKLDPKIQPAPDIKLGDKK